MRRIWTIATFVLATCAVTYAQAPSITAVLDAGGYTSNLAPGTVFVVKGSNLCTSSATANISAAPYSTAAMGGASIAFTPVGGGSAINAFMIYAYLSGSVTQLAGELPNATAAGDYNVTVTTSAGTSATFKTTVVAQKPGLMTISSSGSGRALVQNVVSSTQYDLNGFTSGQVPFQNFLRSPAKPSEFLIAWGVGLGAAPGYDSSAPAAGLNFLSQGLAVKAVVNGVEITPAYAGRSNLFPGLDNVTFQLPANVTTGCWVSLQIKVAGVYSNATTIAIAPNAAATACVDPAYDQATLANLDGGSSVTIGSFNMSSMASTLSFGGQTLTTETEAAAGSFAKYSADQPFVTAAAPVGTAGSCTVTRTTITVNKGGVGGGSTLTLLDAGALTLNGPNVANKAFTETSNLYSLTLSNPIPGSPPVVAAGTYSLTGAGGSGIGAFTGSVTAAAPLRVTGGLPATVTRSQDLVIAWTGGGTQVVSISGTASIQTGSTANTTTFDEGSFYCWTTADKGTFTVPSSTVLSQLPAVPAAAISGGTGFGSLSVLSASQPAAGNGLFSAPLVAGGTTYAGYITVQTGDIGTPAFP